jgi:hypothetical protein
LKERALSELDALENMGTCNSEIIRIDAKGFHYRGQFIEDAGEAHRLMVEFLRKAQPEANWKHADE